MSNKHCGPDIVKYFVVEPTGGGGTTTGATGNFFVCSGTTFLSTISGCTNGVDFNGNTFYNNSDVFFNGVITALYRDTYIQHLWMFTDNSTR